MSDTQHHPGVVGEEAPFRHGTRILPDCFGKHIASILAPA
jgi:hypothetical protein